MLLARLLLVTKSAQRCIMLSTLRVGRSSSDSPSRSRLPTYPFLTSAFLTAPASCREPSSILGMVLMSSAWLSSNPITSSTVSAHTCQMISGSCVINIKQSEEIQACVRAHVAGQREETRHMTVEFMDMCYGTRQETTANTNCQ